MQRRKGGYQLIVGGGVVEMSSNGKTNDESGESRSWNAKLEKAWAALDLQILFTPSCL